MLTPFLGGSGTVRPSGSGFYLVFLFDLLLPD